MNRGVNQAIHDGGSQRWEGETNNFGQWEGFPSE